MADEQAQVEPTTEVQDLDQSTETPDAVSEDVENTYEDSDEREPKGDYKQAMYEERRRRQEIENRLHDPEFFRNLAKQHGYEIDEPQGAALPPTAPHAAPQISQLVQREVAARLDYQEAVKLMPEIIKDPELQAMASALVSQGRTHVEAVKTLQKRLTQVQKEAVAQGKQQAREVITAKEQAQTATATQHVDSDAAEEAKLRQALHNPYNKKAQENALVEILKRQNRQARRI